MHAWRDYLASIGRSWIHGIRVELEEAQPTYSYTPRGEMRERAQGEEEKSKRELHTYNYVCVCMCMYK